MSALSFLSLWFEMPWLLPLAVVLPIVAVMLVLRTHRGKQARVERMGTASVVMRLIPVGIVRAPGWRAAHRLGLAAMLVAGCRRGSAMGLRTHRRAVNGHRHGVGARCVIIDDGTR